MISIFKIFFETMTNYLNLKTQVTCVVDSIEFNNVFLSKLIFYYICSLFINQSNIEE